MNITQIGPGMQQPHLCARCQTDVATLYCMGCRTTTCSAEAIKHFENKNGNYIIPIDELIKASCYRINFIAIQRALMRHTAVFMDDGDTKNGCMETLDEAAPILANVQHELMQKLKYGHIESAF